MASLRPKVDKFAIKLDKFAQVFSVPHTIKLDKFAQVFGVPHTVGKFAIKLGKFATKLDKFVTLA